MADELRISGTGASYAASAAGKKQEKTQEEVKNELKENGNKYLGSQYKSQEQKEAAEKAISNNAFAHFLVNINKNIQTQAAGKKPLTEYTDEELDAFVKSHNTPEQIARVQAGAEKFAAAHYTALTAVSSEIPSVSEGAAAAIALKIAADTE